MLNIYMYLTVYNAKSFIIFLLEGLQFLHLITQIPSFIFLKEVVHIVQNDRL